MQPPPESRTRLISNGEDVLAKLAAIEAEEIAPPTAAELREQAIAEQRRKLEEQVQELVAQQKSECERMKAQYEEQCREILEKAEEEATRIIDDANDTTQLLRELTEKDCKDLRKKSEEEGYEDGFKAGEKPGYDDGFAKGRGECAEILRELSAIVSRIPDEKEKIFKEHENRLFDLIFTISNKVTAGSLNQKDKSVISQMLKEAARSFRGSSYVKVSLSKIDVEESANVDLDELTRIFDTFGERQQVEFEILKDAPRGTLILDNGSEITDAGIQTQLTMIENLGKGKFRDKVHDNEVKLKTDEMKIKLNAAQNHEPTG
jgi:flagellar biosynthesis/type III secretory pathway protein FliH